MDTEDNVEMELLPPIDPETPRKGKAGFGYGNSYALTSTNGIKEGEVRNPKGKPKGLTNFKTRLLKLANKRISYKDLNGRNLVGEVGNAFVTVLMAKALKGDKKAMELILNHTKDKELTLRGDSENPLVVENIDNARDNINRILELATRARASDLPNQNGLAVEGTTETNNP